MSIQHGIIEPLSLDPLTGLPRRDYLRQYLVDDRARSSTLSLLAIDVDHFGEINAGYLISGGDQILRQIARLLTHQARRGDLVVRDGGDQFTIVLCDADQPTAVAEAERLRAVVAATPIAIRTPNHVMSVHVTISVGVATWTPENAGAWDVFERARAAVHDAKADGRNRVAVA